MIPPVFGSLSPRSVLRQAPPAIPAAPPQAEAGNHNPVAQNPAAIPGILEGIQQIMQQRRAQNQNAVRFGMNAQPPVEEENPALEEEDELEEGELEAQPEPETPPHQMIVPPLVAPGAPQANHVALPHHFQNNVVEPLVLGGPVQNLLGAFNAVAQQNQQPQVPQQNQQPPAPPTPIVPVNPFAHSRADRDTPKKRPRWDDN